MCFTRRRFHCVGTRELNNDIVGLKGNAVVVGKLCFSYGKGAEVSNARNEP